MVGADGGFKVGKRRDQSPQVWGPILTLYGGWAGGVTLEAEGSEIGDKDSDQLSSESRLL